MADQQTMGLNPCHVQRPDHYIYQLIDDKYFAGDGSHKLTKEKDKIQLISIFTQACIVCSCLVKLGQFWPSLIKFGDRPNMTTYDQA